MATIRRREEESVRMGVLVRALLVCGVIATLGLGYVRHNAQQLELGRQITEQERRRDRLRQTVNIQEVTIATLVSRPELMARVQRFNLGLVPVAPAQRIFVTVPGAAPGKGPANEEGLMAAGPGGARFPVGAVGVGR
jgi:hypothetical protein